MQKEEPESIPNFAENVPLKSVYYWIFVSNSSNSSEVNEKLLKLLPVF